MVRHSLPVLIIATSIGLATTGWASLLQVAPADKELTSTELAEKVLGLKGVTKVERYLLIKTQPNYVIGVDAGSPLRVVTSSGDVVEGKLETGKAFKKSHEGRHVAIVGRVYAEDYGYQGMGTMGWMKHYLQSGQTFKLVEAGPRIRVLGTFSVEPEYESFKLFLPLSTAQKLFDRSGQLSHLFVTVKGDPDAMARELQEVLGSDARVKVLSP